MSELKRVMSDFFAERWSFENLYVGEGWSNLYGRAGDRVERVREQMREAVVRGSVTPRPAPTTTKKVDTTRNRTAKNQIVLHRWGNNQTQYRHLPLVVLQEQSTPVRVYGTGWTGLKASGS